MAHRWIRPTQILLALSLIAAACGDDDDDDDATEAVTTTSVAADTTAATTSGGEGATTTAAATTAVSTATTAATGAAGAPDPTVFCSPEPSDEAAVPVTGVRGITDDSIALGVIIVDLGQLVDLGFAVDIGPTKAYWETFVAAINEDCGGVYGRQLVPTYYEIGAINNAERGQACIDATERDRNFVIGNSNGFTGDAILCVVEANTTPLILTNGASTDYYERSQGRLYTTGMSFSRLLRGMAQVADAEGLLQEDDVIGIVQGDTPGQPESVAEFVAELTELGYGDQIAVNATIPCNGTSSCTDGIGLVVEEMLDADVTVVFNTMNVVSAPPFTNEAAVQGAEWRYIASGFNSMGGDLTNSKFVDTELGGPAHDGTFIIDGAAAGDFRSATDIPAFNAMCNDVWVERGGEAFDYFDPAENTKYGAVASACSVVRIIYQALVAMGPEPDPDAFVEAWSNLGPVNLSNEVPASITPGSPDATDAVRVHQWSADCVCVTPVDGWEWIEVKD
jgi:hypothetical protein